jgi:uncharacterized membrane protein YccC
MPTGLQVLPLRSALRKMQGQRGLRAGLAVGGAAFTSLLLHHPLGWAALGALYVCLVDNGGPYRLRLGNITAVLVPGALAIVLGSAAGAHFLTGVFITALFCFAMTLIRVVSQPLAASSVLVLICYVVAYGHTEHAFPAAAAGGLQYLLGGLWAAALALVLWPVDPFRPAREAVAHLYASLTTLADALPDAATPAGLTRFNAAIAHTRLAIETAHKALAATPARMTARTLRARNLTVLTESADLLLARILRFSDLAETARQPLPPIAAWLHAALSPIETALQQRPLDNAASFDQQGSRSTDLHRATARLEPTLANPYLITTLHDALFNFEIAYEALRAIWTGAESTQPRFAPYLPAPTRIPAPRLWLESLRSNLTPQSLMFRYALRLAAVVALDTLILHFIHVTHGYWLAMTSLIVLRPFAGETVRRSFERVAGTIAGGLLAAGLTAVFANQTQLLCLVTLCAAGAVAFYAVDYAWYCFFLTPTIVLLTLPRLHDFHLAAVRAEMTFLGALIAVAAMLLLFPERESLQLPRLLARGATANGAYLRATLVYWSTPALTPEAHRIQAERTLLAPARRRCGLAVNDAEDTLDHALLEHALPLNPRAAATERLNRAALTFTTYLRRITRTTTTLAAIGPGADTPAALTDIVTTLAARLEAIGHTLTTKTTAPQPPPHTPDPRIEALPATLPLDQLRRLDRQVSILERATFDIALTTANMTVV